jgi:peptidyl-prolyl cis-trans isomerase C
VTGIREQILPKSILTVAAALAGASLPLPQDWTTKQKSGNNSVPLLNHRRRSIMARASARHILVPSEADCITLKNMIEKGEDFAEIARVHSKCPSGKQGGALGEFGPGQMVREFDEVVFSGAIGTVLGPVKTQFGYHLIEITSRTD